MVSMVVAFVAWLVHSTVVLHPGVLFVAGALLGALGCGLPTVASLLLLGRGGWSLALALLLSVLIALPLAVFQQKT